MILWILVLVGAAGLLLVGCQVTRSGYETAPYREVRKTGAFEVRDYPALTVAETPMAGSGSGADGSFMRLFRFISGHNAAKQKIAMTTPVFMSGSQTNAAMAFVLPAKLTADTAPEPSDGSVRVRALAAGRFAVLRFRGGRNAANEQAALARLQAWMAAESLKPASPPIYAYFDPPWTPPFLRRNEVMVQTDTAK